jgi:glycosyltransferase involved in cell wall biosynthesis
VQRVAVLTEAFLPKVDGVSKTSYLTVRYLQQTGRDVLIFAPDTSVKEVCGSEVVPLPSFPLSVAPETRVAIPTGFIEERLRQFKPDLIHLGSPALMSIYGMIAGRDLNIPVVANYQTDLPGYALHYGMPFLEQPIRDWLRYLHNGCHVTLAPTHTVKQDLNTHGFHRVHVWGRGVNIDQYHPKHRNDTMRQKLLNGRNTDALLCLYVGRLANEKQIDLLLEIARLDGVALTIVGDGAQRAELEHLFDGTNTVFTGYMIGDELAQAYASADVFVFASPNETFGQVVQEALASGLPCVVSKKGSVGELIKPNSTGLLCDQSAGAFADAVATLRDNRDHLRAMSAQARSFAETRPWSAIMSELEDHYRLAVSLNHRFERIFGQTHYHRTARLRSTLATVGLWLGSTVYGNFI